jgi:flagellar motor switch protein FliG
MTANEYIAEGGVDFARKVLERTYGLEKAENLLKKFESEGSSNVFKELNTIDPAQLSDFLYDEHPQTTALILSQLSAKQTAAVLSDFPVDLRADIAHRIATLGKVSADTLTEITNVVQDFLKNGKSLPAGSRGGKRSLAEILKNSSSAFSKDLLAAMERKDPAIASDLKASLFFFEDIVNLDNHDIRIMLREINRKDLAMALRLADEPLKEKIFANMSERASKMMRREIEMLGPVKLKTIEKAQEKIVSVIRNYLDDGEYNSDTLSGVEEVYV